MCQMSVSPALAILQALRQGPAYGQQLERRVKAATGGRVSLGPGSLYPALRGLRRSGLVKGWSVVPGREPGGRSRGYFELTRRGIREAERDAAAIASLARGRQQAQPMSMTELEAARARLERVDELFEFVREVRDSRAGRRGR
jgi:DNA-binding PadR family transcriptional regulator